MNCNYIDRGVYSDYLNNFMRYWDLIPNDVPTTSVTYTDTAENIADLIAESVIRSVEKRKE